MKKKTHTLWITAGILLLASTSTYAGVKVLSSVSLTSTSASGALGTARNSPDNHQLIFCWVAADTDGRTAYCQARDHTGRNARTCQTENALIVDTIASLDGDDALQFNFDSEGNCTGVFVTTGSLYEPKQ